MSSPYYVLSADGTEAVPATLLEWGAFYEDYARRLVADDSIGPVRVVTVFTGIQPVRWELPILWSTKVLGPAGWVTERNHFSRDDALGFHHRMVELARSQPSAG